MRREEAEARITAKRRGKKEQRHVGPGVRLRLSCMP
jgi:hypothetical protein